FGTDRLIGTVSGYDTNTSTVVWGPVPLWADRNIYSATNTTTNYNGTYTMLIPPVGDFPINAPGGYGHAEITVSTNGSVAFAGNAGDGVIIKPSLPTAVAKDGRVPIYI